MKQTINHPSSFRRRVGVAAAKSKLSELLRQTTAGPAIIHNRGRDLAVVLAVEDYDRLITEHGTTLRAGAAFLERVAALKQRHGSEGVDFAPPRFDLKPIDPFKRAPRRRP